MIRSFKCPETSRIFNNEVSPRFPPEIQRTARRKLRQLHAAITLRSLANPPGNRLEALRDDRAGQHSIRINDQWRVCFVWDEGAHDVEIVDYH